VLKLLLLLSSSGQWTRWGRTRGDGRRRGGGGSGIIIAIATRSRHGYHGDSIGGRCGTIGGPGMYQRCSVGDDGGVVVVVDGGIIVAAGRLLGQGVG